MAAPEISFVTVVNRGYLSRADVLFQTLARFHPHAPKLAVLTDRWPQEYPLPSHFEVVTLEEFAPANLWRRLYGYTRFERATTWKSLALQWALARYPQTTGTVLLDADMEIFSTLDPLISALSQASVLLTPHLTTTQADDDYTSYLRAGTFNAGFVGVSRGQGERFLDWWEERLQRHCRIDHPAGMFVEQRWLDLVPSLFDGARTFRHPGANLAYWNLSERPLSGSSEAPLAAGQPVLFFHYSGWSPARPAVLTAHHGGHHPPARDSLMASLLRGYHQRVKDSPYAPLEGSLSALDRDNQGRVISEADSLFFGDVLADLTEENFNPYCGVPDCVEKRAIQGLLAVVKRLPGLTPYPREAPLYRTLSQWARRRLAARYQVARTHSPSL